MSGPSGKVSPLLTDPHGRKSPASEESGSRLRFQEGGHVTKSRGLSCLKPNTLDEDHEPLTKSPEKKPIMSPSGKSISDIFGKVCWLPLISDKFNCELSVFVILSQLFPVVLLKVFKKFSCFRWRRIN